VQNKYVNVPSTKKNLNDTVLKFKVGAQHRHMENTYEILIREQKTENHDNYTIITFIY
jgi:hypothetical protein